MTHQKILACAQGPIRPLFEPAARACIKETIVAPAAPGGGTGTAPAARGPGPIRV
jgi:hypothetical protein